MPPAEALHDDYVASLLLRDAEAHRKGQLSGGFGMGRGPNRRPDAPKPNTTFLRNIIRETDSHNAALKAREASESGAKMRQMRSAGSGGERKRKGKAVEDETDERSKRRRGGEREGRWAAALGDLGSGGPSKRRRSRSRSEREARGEDVDDTRSPRPRHRHHHRHHGSRRVHSRSSSDRDDDVDREVRRRPHGFDERDSRDREPRDRKEHRQRRGNRPTSRSRSPITDRASLSAAAPRANNRARARSDSDSDTLDDFLGPKPPPKVLPRGRGAFRPSDMDMRFRPDYNPRADVGLDDVDGERTDWDMALEALRDRAKWQTQGADRLRAAGFTEEEIGRWEKGERGDGGEKDVEDVRWVRKGEGREWDRGKVADGSGELRLKPDWA